MIDVDKVRRAVEGYDVAVDDIAILDMDEYIEAKYELQAHRSRPKQYKAIFERLLVIALVVGDKGEDVFIDQSVANTSGENARAKSISLGDTSVTYATSIEAMGGATADSGNETEKLKSEFKSIWFDLIANTRQFGYARRYRR